MWRVIPGFDDAAEGGALLFYGARKRDVNCATCHSGDLFTDLEVP